MSVFSKLSITALLVAAPGVAADGFGKSVELNKEKNGLTLNLEEVKHNSVLQLVKNNEVLEAITATQGAATSWTLDGRAVEVKQFVEHPADKGSEKKAGSLKLKPKEAPAAGKAEQVIELELDGDSKLMKADAEKYDEITGDLTDGAEVTSKGDTPVVYVVHDFTASQSKRNGKPAYWTMSAIKNAQIEVEFKKSEKTWTSVGDIKFDDQSEEDFLKLGGDVTEIQSVGTNAMTYTVNGKPTEAEGKTLVKLTLKDEDFKEDDLVFTEKKGQMTGAGKNAGKVLVVATRGDMTFTSDKTGLFDNKDDVIKHMVEQGKEEGQQWYLKIATVGEDKAWYQDAMTWVYISLSIVAVAVICFFVFGGKKDTESDDESDLDTSDDEEEDAAATDAKEEEA